MGPAEMRGIILGPYAIKYIKNSNRNKSISYCGLNFILLQLGGESRSNILATYSKTYHCKLQEYLAHI